MINKKILFLILLAFVLILPTAASAQTIEGMIGSFIANVVRPIAVGAVIALWVVTGILFLTAQGDPGKLKTANMALISAVIGTAIVIVAPIASNIVANSLGI